MLNQAAKKLLTRAARAGVEVYQERIKLGANMYQVAEEAWQQAVIEHPEVKDWRGAKKYFDAVFYGEIEV